MFIFRGRVVVNSCINKPACVSLNIRGCIQKFPDWPPGARTANGTALCHYVQLYRYFVSQPSEFSTITLCVPSRRVFSVVIYFHYDSIRKLLDTPSYMLPWTDPRDRGRGKISEIHAPSRLLLITAFLP
jgi:hypothetical protein